MDSKYGQLTYCTNIHPGETWKEHFAQLALHIPAIKKVVSPNAAFGIGLRLSDTASREISAPAVLADFREWLQQNDCYVFTMNGFPFGNFHGTIVKDQVHAPDWTSQERVDYTIRLAGILDTLVPTQLQGGISTSPLTYRHWHQQESLHEVFTQTTLHLLEVVLALINLKNKSGRSIHIDIEPEPDGLLETGREFIEWYERYLLPGGINFLKERMNFSEAEAVAAIHEHVQLCYDICHFAVGFEDHALIVRLLREKNISIGKIQVSAALKAKLSREPRERNKVRDAFHRFDETTYLHQVIALDENATVTRYRDLPEAIREMDTNKSIEWRAHFHVPLFIEQYEVLQSTQQDIVQVLTMHRKQAMTKHLEIETYTWEVLPAGLKLPMRDSIIRELQWVIAALQSS
ncbi:MAG: xylose isomerase [Chitinophagaceae bacterium]|nr:MAG: xylose isomerase [Chitinophagaceae bacterium]